MERENSDAIAPYAGAVIRLLQGTIFEEDRKVWNDLLTYQRPIREYFDRIGVTLHLDEKDGYAFLTQAEVDHEEDNIPRLIRRIPLSYEVTLLLVVLRESLEEFDLKNIDASKCFISDIDIKEKIEVMFAEKTNKVRLIAKFDSYINQVANLGFLKEVNSGEGAGEMRRFEVRRVIRAKINNEKLEEIKGKFSQNDQSV